MGVRGHRPTHAAMLTRGMCRAARRHTALRPHPHRPMVGCGPHGRASRVPLPMCQHAWRQASCRSFLCHPTGGPPADPFQVLAPMSPAAAPQRPGSPRGSARQPPGFCRVAPSPSGGMPCIPIYPAAVRPYAPISATCWPNAGHKGQISAEVPRDSLDCGRCCPRWADFGRSGPSLAELPPPDMAKRCCANGGARRPPETVGRPRLGTALRVLVSAVKADMSSRRDMSAWTGCEQHVKHRLSTNDSWMGNIAERRPRRHPNEAEEDGINESQQLAANLVENGWGQGAACPGGEPQGVGEESEIASFGPGATRNIIFWNRLGSLRCMVSNTCASEGGHLGGSTRGGVNLVGSTRAGTGGHGWQMRISRNALHRLRQCLSKLAIEEPFWPSSRQIRRKSVQPA